MTATVSRETFVAAIEAGIEAAATLTPVEEALLRHVGWTATEALVGSFDENGCGCPLTLAGIRQLPRTKAQQCFYIQFDRYIDSHVLDLCGDYPTKVVVA